MHSKAPVDEPLFELTYSLGGLPVHLGSTPRPCHRHSRQRRATTSQSSKPSHTRSRPTGPSLRPHRHHATHRHSTQPTNKRLLSFRCAHCYSHSLTNVLQHTAQQQPKYTTELGYLPGPCTCSINSYHRGPFLLQVYLNDLSISLFFHGTFSIFSLTLLKAFWESLSAHCSLKRGILFG